MKRKFKKKRFSNSGLVKVFDHYQDKHNIRMYYGILGGWKKGSILYGLEVSVYKNKINTQGGLVYSWPVEDEGGCDLSLIESGLHESLELLKGNKPARRWFRKKLDLLKIGDTKLTDIVRIK